MLCKVGDSFFGHRGFNNLEIILKNLARRRVAVTGFEQGEAESITRSFATADAIARVVAPGPSLPGLNSYAYFDICVLDSAVSCERDGLVGQIRRSGQPLLLIGGEEAVAQMLSALGGVATDFATRPYRAEELLLRADRLLASIDTIVRKSGQRYVLIAEDEEVTNALIATILKSAGFECASAGNGQEALEMAKQKKPDIVLLDVAMPRLNGFETLAALRAQPETRGLPIIMLTGEKSENEIVRGFELGAEDYIVKPFNARELVARVDRVLRNTDARSVA